MREFTIVYFRWWMKTGSFEQERVVRESREDAAMHADAKCYRNQSTFENWAYCIVEERKADGK